MPTFQTSCPQLAVAVFVSVAIIGGEVAQAGKAHPYLGEIRIFAGDFAPQGWAFCDGQILKVDEYRPLFKEIGARYGGDGKETFCLPDLRGRIPVHVDIAIRTRGDTRGQVEMAANRQGDDDEEADNESQEKNLFACLGLNYIIAIKGRGFRPPHYDMSSRHAVNAEIAALMVAESGIEPDEAMKWMRHDMADAFIGEIRIFAGTSPPGWVRCDGQTLLGYHGHFDSILSNAYGVDGDGRPRVPDLRDRAAVHVANGRRVAPVGLAEVTPSVLLSSPSKQHDAITSKQFLRLKFMIAIRGKLPNVNRETLGVKPLLGEIRMFCGGFVPKGWAPCNHQILAVKDNEALASLLSDRFGGDGKATFALPGLRGRVPVHPADIGRSSVHKLGSSRESVVLVGSKSGPGRLTKAIGTLGVHYIVSVTGAYPNKE